MVRAINSEGVEVTTSRKQAVRYGMRIVAKYPEKARLACEINFLQGECVVGDPRKVSRALLRKHLAECRAMAAQDERCY